MSLTGGEWFVALGLVMEVAAAIVLYKAQADVLKLDTWGYANPNPDVLERSARRSRWGWGAFAGGFILQLLGLAFW